MITAYEYDNIIPHIIDLYAVDFPNEEDYLEPAKARGYIFERICLGHFTATYTGYKFYLWNEAPAYLGYPRQDIGIDIIGVGSENIIGIQCKWRANKRFKTADVDHFYMALKRMNISRGIFISNSRREFKDTIIDNIEFLGPHNTILKKPLNISFLNNLIQFNTLYNQVMKLGKYRTYEARKYQQEAYELMIENYDHISKYIIACGAGKTYIYWLFARWATAQGKTVLIVVPTDILKKQIRQDFIGLNIEIRCY